MRLELKPGLWLDARRAVFLEKGSLLALADLHLGYAWAHRFHGQMLPVHQADQALNRIKELLEFYKPRQVALLGDILHKTVPIDAIEKDFSELARAIETTSTLTLLRGNHDRKLAAFISRFQLRARVIDEFQSENILFLHGDQDRDCPPDCDLTLMGHEHPAITLGDGVSTSIKFPCFLVSKKVIVLPAFSSYSSGTNIYSHKFMSALAQGARFTEAVAILGPRLLRVPLD